MSIYSIREQLIVAVLAAVRPVMTTLGATLYRSPSVAIRRDQCPALVVFPETEPITERSNNRVRRELHLRLVALTRTLPPLSSEAEADRLLTAAHTALMADVNFGGLALSVHEVETEWDIEDADASACAMTTRYQIIYRTLDNNLTLSG